MVMDEPLDFEKEEDPLLDAPRPAKRYSIQMEGFVATFRVSFRVLLESGFSTGLRCRRLIELVISLDFHAYRPPLLAGRRLSASMICYSITLKLVKMNLKVRLSMEPEAIIQMI